MISVNKIQNFNCGGMCSEETCSKPYTHFAKTTINGINLVIPLCHIHANIMEHQELEKRIKNE